MVAYGRRLDLCRVLETRLERSGRCCIGEHCTYIQDSRLTKSEHSGRILVRADPSSLTPYHHHGVRLALLLPPLPTSCTSHRGPLSEATRSCPRCSRARIHLIPLIKLAATRRDGHSDRHIDEPFDTAYWRAI